MTKPTSHTQTNADKVHLEYDYDSFGNVAAITENGTAYTFSYNHQNQLTAAYGKSYAYDEAGRITSYEGATQAFDATHKHAVNLIGASDRYDYDAAGNMITRNKGPTTAQTLTWNSENHLSAISGGGLPTEDYYYDPDGTASKR